VRELENVIERAVVLTKGPTIELGDLPEWVGTRSDRLDTHKPLPPATLADIERMAILQTLQQTNWNKQEAALLLGLYRPTLYSKMRHHNIEDPRRRRPAAAPRDREEADDLPMAAAVPTPEA
jgi:transcriptional regulator of acetoin/glycerol metabolism